MPSDCDEDSPLAHVTKAELQEWQEQDPTLRQAREVAYPEEGDQLGEERVGFLYRDGLLYRRWRPKGTELGDVRGCEQLVLPRRCRSLVLRLAHDIPFAGHLGVTKTKDRIMQRYYWPGIFSDIAKYCRTCQVCQKSGSRHTPRARLIPMPIVQRLFQRIAMDIVGPLPKTSRGNRYILVICNYATRYPEAVALPRVIGPTVVKELIQLFAQVGIPEKILMDQGPNFMLNLLEALYRLLQIRRI